MVNMAHLGLVIECDEKSMTLYHERKVYVVDRTDAFVCIGRAGWAIFKVNDGVVQLIRPYDKKKWNSRIGPNNEILLDVNAQMRDMDCYPILRRGFLDPADAVAEELARQPWSYELDYLEDEDNKMGPTRKGWFHEVTIKFEYKTGETGEFVFSFPIQEVHYESPVDMQLNTKFTPWVEDIIRFQKPAQEMSNYQTLAERNEKKFHKNSMSLGIITKQAMPEMRTVVWSLSAGEHFIKYDAMRNALIIPGDFVYFGVKTDRNHAYANKIIKARHTPKVTAVHSHSGGLNVAKVLVDWPIPEAHLIKPRGMLKIQDHFLGDIEIGPSTMGRLLSKHDLTLPQVYGRLLKVWVIPSSQVTANLTANKYWEPESIHDDIFGDGGRDDLVKDEADE